jgi:tetratricopeptide (TPR) repeat protein
MNPTFSWNTLLCFMIILLGAVSGCVAPKPAPPPPPLACPPVEPNSIAMGKAEDTLNHYEALFAGGKESRADVLAQLARASFIVGQLSPKKSSAVYYRKGEDYAQIMVHEYPDRVEGHYWLAMNLCGQAEAGGYMMGRRLLPKIMGQMEQALALDDSYDQGGPHRVLGRIYYEAPGWPMSVGDISKSLDHLQEAVRLGPENSTNHLFLAQTLYRLKFYSQAEKQLHQVLKCNKTNLTPQALQEDQQQAQKLLMDMKNGKSSY